jgi:transposase
MRDVELYRHLLGLEPPWTVSQVTLDVTHQQVDVLAEHKKQAGWPCPHCQRTCGLHDHEPERTWRHLDSCQFRTLLHARIPRVKCPEHGVVQVRVPWAEPRARFTLLFERLAIEVLLETDISAGARLLGLSWDEAQLIMERAVERGLQRRPPGPPKKMGIDEKAVGRGQQYATLVYDLEHGTVVEVSQGRTKESLVKCLGGFTPNDLAQIQTVAMDMWPAYIQVIKELLPEASSKIVYDKFHIMGHMGDAVDKVRKEEDRKLCQQGDESLKGSKYMWLYAEENLPERHQVRFDALKDSNLKTARAWAIKESLRAFWSSPNRETAEPLWKGWYGWATHSRLEPVKKVAAMLKEHLEGVWAYFEHRVTNAVSEGLNSTIQMLKHRARGYRSFANLRIAILFHCGGLELHPDMAALSG